MLPFCVTNNVFLTYTEQIFKRFIRTRDNPQFIARDQMQSGRTRKRVRKLQYVSIGSTKQPTTGNITIYNTSNAHTG